MEDFSGLRFTVTRLCGGIDLLVRPEKKIPIDLDRVHAQMHSEYQKSREFVNFDWNGYYITLYPAGSILIFHENNKGTAIDIARSILSEVYDERDAEKVGYVDEKV